MLIADAVLNTYSKEVLKAAYEKFDWRGAGHETCWGKRVELSGKLNDALNERSQDNLINVLEKIQEWGLVGGLPQGVRDNAGDVLKLLLAVRDDLSHEVVADLLGFNGAKIATVSKWICLVDQREYAIFDSRVSVALRNVTLNDQRYFPIISRAIHGAWPSDYRVRWKMARYFIDYLACMREVASKVDMVPARVEMALFMIGDERCPSASDWRRNRAVLREIHR